MSLALLVIGTGSLLVGLSLGASPPVTNANHPVDPGAGDQRDITAYNSPTLAANPRDPSSLAVVARVDTPRFSCGVFVSSDSGARWEARSLPYPASEELPPRCYAPDAAFGPDGTLYVSFVTLAGVGNSPSAAWVTTSRDDGLDFTTPVRVSGPLAFQLRVAADRSTAGRLYVTWVQASAVGTLLFPQPGNPVVVSRSDDGGRNWHQVVQVSPPGRMRVVAPSVVVAQGGVVHLVYLDLGDDVLDYAGAHGGQGGPPYPGPWSLVAARSTDRGETWQETLVDDAVVPTQRVIVFFPPSPSLAVDSGGTRVYIGFTDGRDGDADVRVWASGDGGKTFAAGRRVNDTRRGDGTSQYLPKLAVAANGRLDVVYYDRRADPKDIMNEVSLQSSTDGGRRFSQRLRLSDRNFDSRIGFGSERGLPDLGSRLALTSTPRRAVAIWTDTRAGTEASNKQDVAMNAATFHPASRWRPWLLVGAGMTLAVGVIVGLGCWRRRPAL